MKTRSRWLVAVLPLTTALAVFASSSVANAQKITFGGGGAASTTATTTAPSPSATTAAPASTTASTTKVEEKTEEAPRTEEWVARDNAVMDGNTLAGGLGLVHETFQPIVLRLS